MPSISNGTSTHTFVSLKGQVQGCEMMLEEITRKGVDGNAFRQLAKHGEPFQLDGRRDCNNNADAGAVFTAMQQAYQGKVVTVVDDLGKTHANLVCLAVNRVDSFTLARAVGGVSTGKGAFLVVSFTLVSTR